MPDSQSEIARLRQFLAAAKRAVVFTGAGISTESGIPDFRSPGGIWTKYQPIDFRDFITSKEMRRESWRRKFASDEVMRRAEPNRGHRAVAALTQRGPVASVLTQNVDGLHQASGIAPAKIIELHGNATYAICLDCGRRYELDELKVRFEVTQEPPTCQQCDGMIKTATISFGQAMPHQAMLRAEAETLACDLFLAIGSSLVVYPAAGFPALAKRNGARLIIINREATELDGLADLVINREIGPTLGEAAQVN